VASKKAKITPQQAAQELLRRERGKESLLDYAKAIDIPGAPVSTEDDEWLFSPVETGLAAHHNLMLSVMERVIVGELPRAMFFLPPGSAKSTFGSVVAPTWAMGKFKGTKIILTSYGADLAKKHGRKARQIVRDPKYTSIFDTKLSADTSAADEWALENGSEYMAGGILSGITGNRAHGIIIDDPIKGREQADSETIRKKTWEAYQDDLRTRLIPGGWEIIIQTRWHEDDLAGRILPEKYAGETGLIKCRDGREWYIVCLAAQCERMDDPLGRKIGEYLWPEWFTAKHFEGFKSIPRTWSALFQQRPAPETGDYFRREWIRYYENRPERLSVYGASDYAATAGGGDYTAHGVIGVDQHDNIYLLDWWRGQTDSAEWMAVLMSMAKRWSPIEWGEEAGPIAKSLGPFIDKMMREKETYFFRHPYPSVVDKATRAQAIRGRISQGRVFFPKNEWADQLVEEMMTFPAGKNDDGVDVLSLFGRMLADMSAPQETRREKRPPPNWRTA
jgi:predicted phage terminase large subunit-like protein